MNKNAKFVLGASALLALGLSGFALQACSSDPSTSPLPSAGGTGVAGATSTGGAPSAGASSAGAPSAGAQSSAGSGGSLAGSGGDTAGGGGATAGAAGSAGAAGGFAGASGSAGAGGASGASGSAGAGGASGAGGATATTFTLQTAGALGQVLATAAGHTLYVYKPDTPSTTNPVSACTGGCLTSWPEYYGNPVSVPSDLMATDFGSFSNAAMMQSTYKGWPLYTYVGDTAAGQATGDMAGGVWFAVKIPFTAPK